MIYPWMKGSRVESSSCPGETGQSCYRISEPCPGSPAGPVRQLFGMGYLENGAGGLYRRRSAEV